MSKRKFLNCRSGLCKSKSSKGKLAQATKICNYCRNENSDIFWLYVIYLSLFIDYI